MLSESQLPLEFLEDATHDALVPLVFAPNRARSNRGTTYVVARAGSRDHASATTATIAETQIFGSISRGSAQAETVLVLKVSGSDSMSTAPEVVRRLWKVQEPVAYGSSDISSMRATLASLRALCRNGDVDAAVDRCFEVVENAFARRDLASVDELLEFAEPDDLDPRVTVGMLRATSRARDKLQAWAGLLVKEQVRLQRDGRDEKRMLRGLLPTNANVTVSSRTTTA